MFQFVRRYATYKRFSGANSTSTRNYYQLLTSRNGLYLVGGSLGFYIYNLHEAPYTHRRRFIWIPYWLETKIGDYSYQQIKYQFQNQILPPTHPLYKRISNVMNKLLVVALTNETSNTSQQQQEHLRNLKWEINVVASEQDPPNAFILPNGKIFIFSSIIPICQNDDGLATVLSHELSHQLAQHSSEQLSAQPFYLMLSTLLYSITGIRGINDLLISGLLTMPASREMESEADRIGCELMARACFNPESSLGFWARMNQMEKQTGKEMNQWFSTHPATSKRIHDIQSWMPELNSIRDSAGCGHYFEFQQGVRNFFRH
ncbi:Mitochondrial metalloendopeptidase OMA1 [Spathaspora sp. JA1]|nr:Mitochondrial metalloendopeptidase OMA1 [Spathaspora sp. JA1]